MNKEPIYVDGKLNKKYTDKEDETIEEFEQNIKRDYKYAPQLIKLLKAKVYDEETGEYVEGKKTTEQLKSFYSAGRQVTNIIAKSKFKYILKVIQKRPQYKTIIYSVFMENALLLLKKKLLKENIKYVEIDGTISATKRQSNLNLYNTVDSGVNILLISKAGTEGVSTFGTRQIFIMVSQWNPANSEQAIARAIRFKSHMHLPEKERHVKVYRLITALTGEDIKICDDLNSGKITGQKLVYDELLVKHENLIGELTTYYLNKINKINNTTLTLDDAWYPFYEKERQTQWNHWKKSRAGIGRKKAPFNFERPESSRMIMDIIIKAKTTDKNIVKRLDIIKASNKQIDEMRELINADNVGKINTQSPDILLEFTALRKKYEITKMIKRMFKSGKQNVKQVEDYDDETTQQLKKAIESGKDIDVVIKKQQKVLQNRVKSFLKYSSRIRNLFVDKSIIIKPKGNKEGEELQEFHTPEEFADELISYSDILTNTDNKKKNLRILEPTAGYGALVKAVIKARQQHNMNKGYTVEMIEFNEQSRKVIKDMIYDKKKERLPGVLSLQEQTNFLSYVSNELYDVIIMNPPFHLKKRFSGMKADVWDGDFIARAYSLLKPGGEILAIATSMMTKMSHNTMTRKRKNATKFDGLMLDTFVKPPLSTIEIMKQYTAHKWKPKEGKGGDLTLTFTMYKITKPDEEED